MSSEASSEQRRVNQNDMKKMKTRMAYLAWIIMWEATTPPSAQSLPLLYRIIKVVSNGSGPSLLFEVIFAAINPLRWCAVGGIVLLSFALSSFPFCLCACSCFSW